MTIIRQLSAGSLTDFRRPDIAKDFREISDTECFDHTSTHLSAT